jgi:hypothetical protein
MWEFFLNSSRILKDFRRIQYVMLCNASKAKLFLERIFICKINSICKLYALLYWRNFILAKSGCYKFPSPRCGFKDQKHLTIKSPPAAIVSLLLRLG